MNTSPQHRDSPWPHRLAVWLVCATFPLIWVGGLVTTYDAGMAVPDWPSTYGYNLLLYPWQTWLSGPWDLFIEHGHRLLGVLVGLIAIGLVGSVWWTDSRFGMRLAALAALALVVLQGGLGGARVLLDARQIAMVHGCLGPAFFGYAVALAVFTSQKWQAHTIQPRSASSAALHRIGLLTVVFAFLQLVIGAQLRHVSVMASPGVFRGVVFFHLIMAGVVTFHIFQLLRTVRRDFRDLAPLRRPATLLAVLILTQIAMGCATWVVNYGWPEFLAGYSFAVPYTIQAKSLVQALIVTSHAATGSLILAFSVTAFARSVRLVRVPTVALGSGALIMELAT